MTRLQRKDLIAVGTRTYVRTVIVTKPTFSTAVGAAMIGRKATDSSRPHTRWAVQPDLRPVPAGATGSTRPKAETGLRGRDAEEPPLENWPTRDGATHKSLMYIRFQVGLI
ncbi:hypothetical protein OOZ63_29040, partial [Paucibacter sp. PLA-PC-4]|uniref:hypothetical protein n=1 Tax=Paucibacter sp. PLA-PC-4 TaxID=2993655 RepID=UPI00224B89F5